MRAEELLREGNLDQALTELTNQVREDPSDAKLRVFLFQLLSVLGQWDRGLDQLNVAGELDSGTLAMVQTYREALRCEALRTEVFAGRRSPLVFGEPDEWLALLMEALRQGAAGRFTESQELRSQAFDLAPTTPGTIVTREAEAAGTALGKPFEWIADADSRMGPVLEVVVNGKYYWIPFNRIREIHIEPPADLRDVVWTPGLFVWANGGEAVGLVPTRYPGTAESDNDELRLARRTEWTENEGGAYFGIGQRMLATDEREFALMDIHRITLDADASEGTEPDAPRG